MQYLFESDLTFRQIRQGNYIYADKTEYIHKILNGKPTINCCFLVRPRRFGKTLLLDTIGELFQGDRELFRGLWIDRSDYKFDIHPVLKFNMATYTDMNSKDLLIARIKADLNSFANKHKVAFSTDFYPKMIEELLEGLSNKYGAGVVILVDEYDAPVTRFIMDQGIADGNREVLHDFYAVLKANIKFIRLAFVTGITRFAMSALDSGANNFRDISLLPKFAGICGFTVKEMNSLFQSRFRSTLRRLKKTGQIESNANVKDMKNKIREYYDGYNWLGKNHVLNPVSLMEFFDKKKFGPYWPMSGKPSLLSALVRENPLDLIKPKLDGYTEADLSILKPATVLFHSGYLTIAQSEIKTRKIDGKNSIMVEEYTFKIPSLEVAYDFEFTIFSSAFDPKNLFFSSFADKLPSALLKEDSGEMATLLHNLLSTIASEQHEPSEKRYHAVLQAAFIATGIEVIGQSQSSEGKSDMSAFLKNTRVVIEVKYCRTCQNDSKDIDQAEKDLVAALDKAADQIKSKDYAAPLRVAEKKVIGVAIAVRGRNEVAVRFIEP
jgi:hypothetical protein